MLSFCILQLYGFVNLIIITSCFICFSKQNLVLVNSLLLVVLFSVHVTMSIGCCFDGVDDGSVGIGVNSKLKKKL